MYNKHTKAIGDMLAEFKADKVTKAQATQFVQNIIGEELLRVDVPVDKFEVDEVDKGLFGDQ